MNTRKETKYETMVRLRNAGLPEGIVMKMVAGPKAMIEGRETIVSEGSKYRLFVISDKDQLPVGYRLRPIPIDPNVDYTKEFEDFNLFNPETGKGAFVEALEKFSKGNEEFDKLLEQTRK